MMENRIAFFLGFTLAAVLSLFLVHAGSAQGTNDTMQLGTNFWNFGWNSADRDDYYQSGIDWNTVENPWRQEFLDDIQIYSVIRFMDQVPTNSSTIQNWDERTLPTENHYNTESGAVAYEWQIDLVNRTGSDIWITVPHLTIESYEDDPGDNYWTELATLLKTELDPDLNIYVEYSNETWSSGSSFQQGDYAGDRGVDMEFDTDEYTAKFYFHVYAAMRLHKVFLDVFDDQQERIKTVVAGQGGSLWGTQQIVLALQNQTWNMGEDDRLNPWDLEPDYFTIANYISTGDGADPDIRDAWTSELASAEDHYQQVLDEIASTGMGLIAYEGGQHYTNNAHLFSQNPESYDMYLEWLDMVSDYFELTMHYTHLGNWSSGGSWGAKTTTDQSIDDAHKYRALRDWVLGAEAEIMNIFLSNNIIDEGLPAGTLIGVLSTNMGNDEEFEYSIIDGDTESFEIEANELFTEEVFDYNTKNSYEITISATDPEDPANTFEKDFTIIVNKVPEGEEVVLNPIADTDLQSDPDGTDDPVNVSRWNHMFFKYDLSGISEVNSARVRVYHTDGFNAEDHTLYLHEVPSDDWEEGGPLPDLLPDPNQAMASQDVTDFGYVEFEVIDYVQNKLSESTVTFGYNTNTDTWQPYHSRENVENKPELVLVIGDDDGTDPDPDGEDQRILVSNRSDYIFSGEDFGIEDGEYSVQIETLPDEGMLLLNGDLTGAGEVITTEQLNAEQLSWEPPAGEHGYGYTSFEFRLADPDEIPPPPPPPDTESPSDPESGEVHTLTIDLAAATVELTGGQGWRFLTSPAAGETYSSLLDLIWTQGVPGSDNPGASSTNVLQFDHQVFWWGDIPGMDQSIGQGEAFIVYVLSDEDNDGSPEGFPKTLTSLEDWAPLDGSFGYNGLDYDPDPEGANPNNLFLVANPHPVSVDFCAMFHASTNIGSSNWIWNPAAGGGNGDYVNLNCAVEEEIPVAPFQGFWVRTTDANPSLGVPEEAYLGGPEEGFFKENLQQEEPFHIVLNLRSEDKVFANKVNILFSEEGTPGMDRFDAPKISPAGLADRWLSFYALDEQNRRYAFRSLPRNFGKKISIPLDIETTDEGTFILDWSLLSTGGFSGSYWLLDNHVDEMMELINEQSYRFEVADVAEKRPDGFSKPVRSKDGSSEPRFELLVATGGAGSDDQNELPSETRLRQNYPNPFNPSTMIRYELPQTSDVRLEVFDLTGRRVAILVDGQVSAGHHQFNFVAGSLSSGVYVYRLEAEGVVQTKKMLLVK